MLACKIGISLRPGYRCRHDKHVAALLDRHVASVVLADCAGIAADIMGGEILVPLIRSAVIENRIHQSFRELGIVKQKQWH